MRPVVSLSLCMIVLAACAGAQTPATPSPSPIAAATASPAVPPSVAPSPSAVPSAPGAHASGHAEPTASAGGPIPDGPVSPGTYTSTSLGETITFTIDEPGWTAFADIPGVGLALSREGIPGGVTITTFDGEVFSQPCSPEETESVEATAAEFVGWLAQHPELNATEPVETTLGGHPAIQLDVTSDVEPECPEAPRIWLWVLPVVGDFHLDENEAARFIVADIDEAPTVVVIESFEAARQPELLEAAQPILDSMTIEP